ncbi:MAG: alpha/beta fold hydrolase [Gammaproteobacteria bacterium]|nr:alpha/beta fold hydrolase [Gammaproteobacteria bacterium]
MRKEEATLSPEKKYYEALDRSLQIATSRGSGGLSPAALALAFYDLWLHVQSHPAKQFELTERAQDNFWYLFSQYFCEATSDEKSGLCKAIWQDKRFSNQLWQHFPYSFLYESFLAMQNWWQEATTDVRGLSKHHQDVVNFSLRQYLDMLSPSNSPLLNPEVQQAALSTNGENFIKGYENFLDDLKRYQTGAPPHGAENYVVGKNIAVTPGKVIYCNNLIELIQYSPTTKQVYAEPILITPAWIMKYYILDLSQKHSLVKYLVDQGHTVFMISWKNPKSKDRDLGMEDYLQLGILNSLDVINAVVPRQKIHLVGYCLGGTLAAIAAATMARDDDHRLASMTLFAAQVDFTEPGELGLFIDESQIAYLESLMAEKGYLDTHQMAGAFQLLRSNDLIWSRIIREYLLGERKPLTDLMAWNADATRLPYRMHSEYLRQLFLHNTLAKGNYLVKGRPIALTDINIPMFVVATERDHVSPWASVFKINILTKGDVTFVLTSGGHNAGIVSLPSKKATRYFRISTLKKVDHYIDPQSWYERLKPKEGSWWPAWETWIAKLSPKKKAPPTMGAPQKGYAPLLDAPGKYVNQK